MPGMMHSRVSGRGVWCDCCSAWTATRAREKRDWQREANEEAYEHWESLCANGSLPACES